MASCKGLDSVPCVMEVKVVEWRSVHTLWIMYYRVLVMKREHMLLPCMTAVWKHKKNDEHVVVVVPRRVTKKVRTSLQYLLHNLDKAILKEKQASP